MMPGKLLKAELFCAAIRSWNGIGPNGKSIDSHIEKVILTD
jgi:hypothetical protein